MFAPFTMPFQKLGDGLSNQPRHRAILALSYLRELRELLRLDSQRSDLFHGNIQRTTL